MRFLLLLVSLINLFLLSSCKKYVPANDAFFIKPTTISVSTSTAQGTSSHKITDLWLYVDGKFQGAYPSGNLMPIVTKGQKVKINILAGIKNNGISGTRISWTFYDFITIDTLVESGKTIERPITFKYNANTKFTWMENFELTVYTLKKSNTNPTDTNWKFASAAESFEGKSIEVGLTGNALVAQVESSITYTIPSASSNVFLEINYKANQAFEVGMVSGSVNKPAIMVNPSDTWNKIYIQLADVYNRDPKSSAQKVYFKLLKTSENANPKMFLDNIKLIHF
jgi:hypothetical protein